MTTSKVVLITGASTRFGRATTKRDINAIRSLAAKA